MTLICQPASLYGTEAADDLVSIKGEPQYVIECQLLTKSDDK